MNAPSFAAARAKDLEATMENETAGKIASETRIEPMVGKITVERKV